MDSQWYVNAPMYSGDSTDRQKLWELNGNLTRLQGYILDFSADLDLFDFAEQRLDSLDRGDWEMKRKFSHWKAAAANDAAMTVYHFGKVRGALPGLIMGTECLAPLVDRAKLGKSGKFFETQLSDWALTRKGVAHSGDFAKSQNDVDNHKTRDSVQRDGLQIAEGAGVFISGMFQGRDMIHTVEGKLVSFSMTKDTLEKLYTTFELLMEPLAEAFMCLSDIHRASLGLSRPRHIDRTHHRPW